MDRGQIAPGDKKNLPYLSFQLRWAKNTIMAENFYSLDNLPSLVPAVVKIIFKPLFISTTQPCMYDTSLCPGVRKFTNLTNALYH